MLAKMAGPTSLRHTLTTRLVKKELRVKRRRALYPVQCVPIQGITFVALHLFRVALLGGHMNKALPELSSSRRQGRGMQKPEPAAPRIFRVALRQVRASAHQAAQPQRVGHCSLIRVLNSSHQRFQILEITPGYIHLCSRLFEERVGLS
jgi:hypothetical protein